MLSDDIIKINFLYKGSGSAPDYGVIIYPDRTIIFNAISENYKIPIRGEFVAYGTDENGVNIRASEIKGIYKAKLSKRKYREIIGLLDQMEKEFEQKRFAIEYFHSSSAFLTVQYTGDLVKSIYDAGAAGYTEGSPRSENLVKFYEIMNGFRFGLEWE